MLDAAYQSVICFFMPYLLFAPANFVTGSGHNVNDYKQFGVYIANAVVIVVNSYVLMNTYRWDWFMMLMVAFSILLIFFWTGVYTSFTTAFTFYGAASHCYGSLSFWAVTLLTVIICLLPRFAVKSFQKMFMPLDVDVIREQVRQGKFAYLDDLDPARIPSVALKENDVESSSASDVSKPMEQRKISHSRHRAPADDETRPFYAPSIANTSTTNHPYSPQGSDGTAEFNSLRNSLDRAFPPVGADRWHSSNNTSGDNHQQFWLARPPPMSPIESDAWSRRASQDRPRPSFDRLRMSLERSRSNTSFEGSSNLTSAAYLSRVESTHQHVNGGTAAGSGAATAGTGPTSPVIPSNLSHSRLPGHDTLESTSADPANASSRAR